MKPNIFRTYKGLNKEGVRFNRRMITFLFCILISVLIWLLMALSQQYIITVTFPVKYINMPADKLISNHLPEKIDLEVRSSGFNLLSYKLRQQRETVLVDINDARSFSRKNYYIRTNERLDKITNQFNHEMEIISIFPDTIFINYNKKVSKRVPVKTNITISFDEQYQLTDSIRIEPKYIEIAGSPEVLDKIDSIETAPLNLKNVSSTAFVELEILKSAEYKQLEFSQTSVQAKINVTKFTEAVLELPVEVENLPSGLMLKTFPDKISVKYQVAYDDYGKINGSDFRVAVDYSKIEKGSNKLKVLLLKSPPQVRSVKLSNEKVEFIIRK